MLRFCHLVGGIVCSSVGIDSKISQANLTSLVSVVSSIANTTEGMALLSQLSQGNKTVFAPNNQAFVSEPLETTPSSSYTIGVLTLVV